MYHLVVWFDANIRLHCNTTDAIVLLSSTNELQMTKVQRITFGSGGVNYRQQNCYPKKICGLVNSLATLHRLELRGCNLGPSDAVYLSTLLAENTTIRCLNLIDNQVGDDGAFALSTMLKKNRTLRDLLLDSNGITQYGQHALKNSIYDDTTFESIQNSNHVLISFFIDPRKTFGRTALGDVLYALASNLRSHSHEQSATKKLVRFLKRKYQLRFHHETFLALETDYMPLVLGWVGDHCDVNSMYDIVRHMPGLFEAKRGNVDVDKKEVGSADPVEELTNRFDRKMFSVDM